MSSSSLRTCYFRCVLPAFCESELPSARPTVADAEASSVGLLGAPWLLGSPEGADQHPPLGTVLPPRRSWIHWAACGAPPDVDTCPPLGLLHFAPLLSFLPLQALITSARWGGNEHAGPSAGSVGFGSVFSIFARAALSEASGLSPY